ncbi:hypothetical protein DM01DRAFT_1333229 [Hesseltinella vesiculosa]|uniref:S-adenosyl-L-methionine-dependent methyltransferase n=1 Tax=Hesseltinella vesiculosa TaxID=101127 RepID=A0A1X2GRS9_9FUNG|nr:hypothetical protein DM01DRAFT_1333229 [Hesseltinella vesiculosa]
MEFMDHLHSHSGLLRLVPRRPFPVTIAPMQWYRLEFHMANELGTLLPSTFNLSDIHVECSLLDKSPAALSSHWHIDWQLLLQQGAWDSEPSLQIQFLIRPINTSLPPHLPAHLMVMVSPTYDGDNSFYMLPLITAPFCLTSKRQTANNLVPNNRAWSNYVTQHMYRGFSLPCFDQRYFLIRESWVHGTPGKLWDSALVISDALARQLLPLNLTRPLKVLDLSAGTGVIGLLLAFIGQHQNNTMLDITLTDVPEALSLIHDNRCLNKITYPRLSVAPLRWGIDKDIQAIQAKGPFDVIIASDVLYEPIKFQDLVKTLDKLTTPSTQTWIGYKRRGLKLEEEQSFFTLCHPRFQILDRSLDENVIHCFGWLGPHAPTLTTSLPPCLPHRVTGVQIFHLSKNSPQS